MASTTSITNTPQAEDDSYVFTESEWLANGMVSETTQAGTTTTVLTLDVMSNDSGGKAKSLYSVEASAEFTEALLSSDVGSAPERMLDEYGNYTGIQVWIENGKIMVDVTDALAALGASSLADLDAGQVIEHSFTYAIQLGNGTFSAATVHFSITGEGGSSGSSGSGGGSEGGGGGVPVNLPSVIEGDLTGIGDETNDPLELRGQLTLRDDDSTDTHFETGSQDGRFGTFTLDADGRWTFLAYSAYDELATDDTLSESFEVRASDGSTQQVTVTITGTNDAATMTGEAFFLLREDSGDNMRFGQMTVDEDDTGEEGFTLLSQTGNYGSFSFDATTGEWSYTLANSSDAVQNLGNMMTVYDSMTVGSLDGTASQTVTIGVQGVDEPQASQGNTPPLITVDGSTPLVQTIGEDELGMRTLHWDTSIDDPDDPPGGAQDTFQYNGTGQIGAFGVFTYDAASQDWFYTLDARAQALASGQTGVDSYDAKSHDGSRSITLTALVVGANDEARIEGNPGGEVWKGDVATTGGTLTVIDPDQGENEFQALDPGMLQGQYGSFIFDTTTGAWSYALEDDRVANLGRGEIGTDTLMVTSKDGSAETTISVLVNGSSNTQYGADGNDILIGTDGSDILHGSGGNDILLGRGDNDFLFGGDGDDELFGEEGDDILWGGLGDNDLYGGDGADTFYFRAISGPRQNGAATFIVDFDATQDQVVLSTLPDSSFAMLAGYSAQQVFGSYVKMSDSGTLYLELGDETISIATFVNWDGFSAANLYIGPVDEYMEIGRASSGGGGGVVMP